MASNEALIKKAAGYKDLQPAKLTPQQECANAGGKWDSVLYRCIMNAREQVEANMERKNLPKQDIKTKEVNPPKGSVETYTTKEGVPSGVSFGGKDYLGLSPDEVRLVAQQQQDKYAMPENSQPVGTAQAGAERQQRLQQLMQMGEQGLLTPQELQAIQEAPINWSQAITAGASNIPSILTRTAGGATAGAVAGGALGLGIGAVPGAILGGIGGFISAIWSGTQANIKAQQRGEIGKSTDVLTNAKTNLRQLRMVAEQDPTKAEEAVQMYYYWVNEVRKAERKTFLETQGDLNAFMEDGADILSDFELFLRPGGYADIQKMRLDEAVMRGTPATPEQIMQIYQEEYESE